MPHDLSELFAATTEIPVWIYAEKVSEITGQPVSEIAEREAESRERLREAIEQISLGE